MQLVFIFDESSDNTCDCTIIVARDMGSTSYAVAHSLPQCREFIREVVEVPNDIARDKAEYDYIANYIIPYLRECIAVCFAWHSCRVYAYKGRTVYLKNTLAGRYTAGCPP